MLALHLAAGFLLRAFTPKERSVPSLLGAVWLDFVKALVALIFLHFYLSEALVLSHSSYKLTFFEWNEYLVIQLLLALIWAFLFNRDWSGFSVAFLGVFSAWLSDAVVYYASHAVQDLLLTDQGVKTYDLEDRVIKWFVEGCLVALFLVVAYFVFKSRHVPVKGVIFAIVAYHTALAPILDPQRLFLLSTLYPVQLVYGLGLAAIYVAPTVFLTIVIDMAEDVVTTSSAARSYR